MIVSELVNPTYKLQHGAVKSICLLILLLFLSFVNLEGFRLLSDNANLSKCEMHFLDDFLI